jgi:hypothetical protein
MVSRVRRPVSPWLSGHHSALVHSVAELERSRTGAWITAALAAGRRVVYKDVEPETAAPWLARLAGVAALTSGRLLVVDAATCHADTGGDPTALLAWHAEHLGTALADGCAGVAFTADLAALRTITPDPDALLAHERDLAGLAAAGRGTVLCRYDLTELPDRLDELAALHLSGLEDVEFAARLTADGRALQLAGVVDEAGSSRFAAVLTTAFTAGIRDLDVAEVRLFSAAGLRALARALTTVTGDRVVARNASSPLRRALAVGPLPAGALAVD